MCINSRLDERLFVSILMFTSNMSFEVIKSRPPLPSRAIARIRACGADVTDLISDSRRRTMDRLPVALEVVLCSEALRSGTATLTASEWLGVL